MEATATPVKAKIRPNIDAMVKTKSGSFHKDDFVGNALTGLTIEQVKIVAAECGIDANKYDHLNAGQQRMNLGNRLRALAAHKEGAKDEESEATDKIRDLIDNMAEGFASGNMAAAAAAAEAKAADKAAKAAAKPKKEKKVKVTAPEPIDGEGDTLD